MHDIFIAFAVVCFCLAIQCVIRGAFKVTFARSPFQPLAKIVYLIIVPLAMYNIVSPTMALISFGYAVKHVFGYDTSLSPFQQSFFAIKHGRIANKIGYGIMFIGFIFVINFAHV